MLFIKRNFGQSKWTSELCPEPSGQHWARTSLSFRDWTLSPSTNRIGINGVGITQLWYVKNNFLFMHMKGHFIKKGSKIYIHLQTISRQTLMCYLLNLKLPSSAWVPDIPLLFTFHLEQTGLNTIQNQKWKQNIWGLEYRLFLYCQLSLDLHAFKISLGEDRVSVLLWKWKDLSPDSPGPTSCPLPGWAASCPDGSPPWTCFRFNWL